MMGLKSKLLSTLSQVTRNFDPALQAFARQVELELAKVSVNNDAPAHTVTGDYTVTATDTLVCVDTSIDDVTVFLPEISDILVRGNYDVTIKKDADANTLFIIPDAADNIDGEADGAEVLAKDTALNLKATESGWRIV